MKTKVVLILLIMMTVFVYEAVSAKDPRVMPDLQGRDLSGKKVRLSDLKGNVVVVSFWATWCTPCKRELKVLNDQLRIKKDKGLRVIAVSMDGPDTVADIRGVVKRYKWKMTVIHDRDGSITAIHNPRAAAPFTIFVDRKSRASATHVGYSQGDKKKIVERIDDLLARAAK